MGEAKAGDPKSRPGIGRFWDWMFSKKKADEMLTEEEKKAQGNKDKDEAWKELDKEYAEPTATASPSPTPGRTATPTRK